MSIARQHRTEFPQAQPHKVSVAGFTWNAPTDGKLTITSTHLVGSARSIVFGGFLHVFQQIEMLGPNWSFQLRLGDEDFLLFEYHGSTDTPLLEGWYPLDHGQMWDVTKNFPVSIDYWSHVRVHKTGVTASQEGQACLYLFYINNELGLHGQLLHPTLPVPPYVDPFPPPIEVLVNELLLDTSFFFRLDNNVNHLLLDVP